MKKLIVVIILAAFAAIGIGSILTMEKVMIPWIDVTFSIPWGIIAKVWTAISISGILALVAMPEIKEIDWTKKEKNSSKNS